jgi:hypothetical protein
VATDRLGLYNGALRECGERRLASLSENREPRRVLDDIWNGGQGIVVFALQAKQWRFGRRLVEMTPETAIEPTFGRLNAYAVPDDWARTCKLCQDERMEVPLLDYEVEAGFWYTDLNPIYLSYISTDENYGGNMTLWPPNFVLWVETHMASLLAPRLMGSEEKTNRLIKLATMRLKEAASTDAMEDPTKFPPPGSFVMARRGNRSGYRDRGPRGRLIG